MPAYYKLVRNPNPRKDGKKQPLHPRFAPLESFKKEELLLTASAMYGFSSAQITGVVQLIQDLIVHSISQGRNLELEGIGTFSASLTCRPVMEEDEIKGGSVHFHEVTFRPSGQLNDRLRGISFYRKEDTVKATPYSLEQRKERLMKYLETQPKINRNKYISLNRCSKTVAGKDLKLFQQEGLIETDRSEIAYTYTKK